jgi:undecaprenyl phosphate-alpha-L-ara4N flippase subunit ArnF
MSGSASRVTGSKPHSRPWLGAALLAASIVLSAAGQLGMKAGMQSLHALHSLGVIVDFHLAPDFGLGSLAPLRPAIAWTLGGLAAYGFSLLAWLAVLVRYPLSYAYPLLGISYVLVYLGATHWDRLMEPMTPMRTAGTLLILAGVALVSVGGTRKRTASRDDEASRTRSQPASCD